MPEQINRETEELNRVLAAELEQKYQLVAEVENLRDQLQACQEFIRFLEARKARAR